MYEMCCTQVRRRFLRRRAGRFSVPEHLRRNLGDPRRLKCTGGVAIPRRATSASHVPGQAQPGHHRHVRQLIQAYRRLCGPLVRLRSAERLLLRPHGGGDSTHHRARADVHRAADHWTRAQCRVNCFASDTETEL